MYSFPFQNLIFRTYETEKFEFLRVFVRGNVNFTFWLERRFSSIAFTWSLIFSNLIIFFLLIGCCDLFSDRYFEFHVWSLKIEKIGVGVWVTLEVWFFFKGVALKMIHHHNNTAIYFCCLRWHCGFFMLRMFVFAKLCKVPTLFIARKKNADVSLVSNK